MTPYEIYLAIEKLAKDRDWGFGDIGEYKAMTRAGGIKVNKFFYINFARLAITKYVEFYNKKHTQDSLYKLSYFRNLYKSPEELGCEKYSVIKDHLMEYLDECMMEVIRKELPQIRGIKIHFYSCKIAYNAHFNEPEVAKTKRTYTV